MTKVMIKKVIQTEYGEKLRRALLQNTFIVSADKIFLVSVLQTDTIYTIQKRRSF
jgi:hypothetical protein